MVSKTEQLTTEGIEIKKATPKKYRAIIHNDETTTFDFVISVLVEIYKKPIDEAIKLTLLTHETGSAVVMVGLRGYLEALSDRAMTVAHNSGFKHFTITNEPE